MGKSSSAKAPEYPTTKVDTGLYGTTTTNQSGTTATYTPFQQQLVSTAEQNVPNLLNYMVNPTADNQYFKNQSAVRQDLYNKAFENNVVNPLAERNLTRGSSVNALANTYANDIAQQERQALADSVTQAQNVYNTLMGAYQTPYNMFTTNAGISNNQANSIANYNAAIYKAQQEAQAQKQAAMWQALGQASAEVSKAAPAAAAMVSDKHLKENIKKLAEIDGYNIYEFNYIDDDKRQVGVIAQEMEEIQPDCVIQNYKGTEYMAVDYNKLPQAVQDKIEELK